MNTVFEIRSALQWSQSKLADEIGVSFATVNRWENEKSMSQIHETRESFTAKVRSSAEKTARVHMALLQIAQQENLVPTEEDIDKALAARAERAKKTLEEIKEKSDIPAMRRNEGIRKAADWVIEHSTIEEK